MENYFFSNILFRGELCWECIVLNFGTASIYFILQICIKNYQYHHCNQPNYVILGGSGLYKINTHNIMRREEMMVPSLVFVYYSGQKSNDLCMCTWPCYPSLYCIIVSLKIHPFKSWWVVLTNFLGFVCINKSNFKNHLANGMHYGLV